MDRTPLSASWFLHKTFRSDSVISPVNCFATGIIDGTQKSVLTIGLGNLQSWNRPFRGKRKDYDTHNFLIFMCVFITHSTKEILIKFDMVLLCSSIVILWGTLLHSLRTGQSPSNFLNLISLSTRITVTMAFRCLFFHRPPKKMLFGTHKSLYWYFYFDKKQIGERCVLFASVHCPFFTSMHRKTLFFYSMFFSTFSLEVGIRLFK